LQATLALFDSKANDGGSQNWRIGLDFRHGNGVGPDERRQSIITKLWGVADSVKHGDHTPELLAASDRARAKLADLKDRFSEGLPSGHRLLFKVPFPTIDGRQEYMWVEVLQWREEGLIKGVLQNEPFYVKDLSAGSNVEVLEEKVFDYILDRGDGSKEGNETGIILRRQKASAQKE
jgi:uncharacterized protein YegJ (DUF2314 family)